MQTVGEIERAAQTVAILRRIADAQDAIHGTLAALLDTVKWAAGGQMTSNDAVKKRWGRKVCGEAAAACARTGKMPRFEFESGSGPLVIRASTELRGLGAAARRCGVSHTHLRKVLQGERVPSAALAGKMRKIGLTPGMMKAEVE